VGFSEDFFSQKTGQKKSENVHESVPADFESENREGDGIEVPGVHFRNCECANRVFEVQIVKIQSEFNSFFRGPFKKCHGRGL